MEGPSGQPSLVGEGVRVFGRVLCFSPSRPTRARKELTVAAHSFLPDGRAGDFNQALMDLGSMVCLAKTPRCGVCPVASHCQAEARGVVDQFPIRATRRKAPQRLILSGALWRGEKVLLARRAEQGLYGGLWELPSTRPLAPKTGTDPHALLQSVWSDSFGLGVSVKKQLGEVRHTLTHMQLVVGVHVVVADDGPKRVSGYTAFKWVDPHHPGELALSSLAQKTLALLTKEA